MGEWAEFEADAFIAVDDFPEDERRVLPVDHDQPPFQHQSVKGEPPYRQAEFQTELGERPEFRHLVLVGHLPGAQQHPAPVRPDRRVGDPVQHDHAADRDR